MHCFIECVFVCSVCVCLCVCLRGQGRKKGTIRQSHERTRKHTHKHTHTHTHTHTHAPPHGQLATQYVDAYKYSFYLAKERIDVYERIAEFLTMQAPQRLQPDSIAYFLRTTWSLPLRLLAPCIPHLMEGRRQSAATTFTLHYSSLS